MKKCKIKSNKKLIFLSFGFICCSVFQMLESAWVACFVWKSSGQGNSARCSPMASKASAMGGEEVFTRIESSASGTRRVVVIPALTAIH